MFPHTPSVPRYAFCTGYPLWTCLLPIPPARRGAGGMGDVSPSKARSQGVCGCIPQYMNILYERKLYYFTGGGLYELFFLSIFLIQK